MTENASYQIEERTPTLAEYQALCTAVGWESVINFEVAQRALDRSLYGIVVLSEGEAVGMGRIVGDGAIFFYLQDIAVIPSHQGRGVGRLILDKLIAYLQANAPEQAFIGLFAANGTTSFYERFGFVQHEGLTGMFQVVPRARSTR